LIAYKINQFFYSEKTIDKLLEKYTERVNTNREFFRILPDDLRVFFDLIDGSY
jgi:hypothetical protein